MEISTGLKSDDDRVIIDDKLMEFDFIEDSELREKVENQYKDNLNTEVDGLKRKNNELLEEKKKVTEKYKSYEGIDLEKAQKSYRGFTNRTTFPILEPTTYTAKSSTYDLLVIESDKAKCFLYSCI